MSGEANRRCEVEFDLPVRTYDIDYAGIVSNIVYIRWLEDLRMILLERYLPLQTFHARGITPVLLHTDIQYRRAIRLFQAVTGRMWVSDVGKARWSLAAEIEVEDQIAATAQHELAVVNLTTFRPVPVPMEIRELCS